VFLDVGCWLGSPCGFLEVLDSAEPVRYPVPTGSRLIHHPFISILDRPQVAEGRCGYPGSNKAVSVERDSLWKEQMLEPLALLKRRLHPQIGGARQNAFCEREDERGCGRDAVSNTRDVTSGAVIARSQLARSIKWLGGAATLP
jgi:hypothetical protein